MNRAAFGKICLSLPRATSDFPFDEETEVFRLGGKMFALCARSQTNPVTANLKCDPDLASDLRAAWPGEVLPGWHQNHRHWNTVRLDGSLPDAKLEWMIRHSWELVRDGLPRALREELGLPRGRSPVPRQ